MYGPQMLSDQYMQASNRMYAISIATRKLAFGLRPT